MTVWNLNALIASGHNNILVISYNNVRESGLAKYLNLIRSGSYSLIFVDRADLYFTDELYDALWKSGAIVYLDLKLNLLPIEALGDKYYIELSNNEVRYYVD